MLFERHSWLLLEILFHAEWQDGWNWKGPPETVWSGSPFGCALLTVTTWTTYIHSTFLAPINNLAIFYKLFINQVLVQSAAKKSSLFLSGSAALRTWIQRQVQSTGVLLEPRAGERPFNQPERDGRLDLWISAG